MAEESTDVGPLIVSLTGGGDLLPQIEASIAGMLRLEAVVKAVGSAVDALNARPVLPGIAARMGAAISSPTLSRPVMPFPAAPPPVTGGFAPPARINPVLSGSAPPSTATIAQNAAAFTAGGLAPSAVFTVPRSTPTAVTAATTAVPASPPPVTGGVRVVGPPAIAPVIAPVTIEETQVRNRMAALIRGLREQVQRSSIDLVVNRRIYGTGTAEVREAENTQRNARAALQVIRDAAAGAPVIQPRFDFQQTAVRARMAEILNGLREQVAAANREFEVHTRVFGPTSPEAQGANTVRRNAEAELARARINHLEGNAGISAPAPRFDLQEQTVRNQMAELVRGLRAQAAEARINVQVQTRVYGAGSEQARAAEAVAETANRAARQARPGAIRVPVDLHEESVRNRMAALMGELRQEVESARINVDVQTRIYGTASGQAQTARNAAREANERLIAAQNNGGQAPEEGDEHGGHVGHYLARRVAYHVGQSVGASGLSNEVTLLMTLSESFGPAGLVAASMIGIVSGIRSVATEAKRLRDEQAEYNAELMVSSRLWGAMAAAQVATTSAGKTAKEGAEGAENKGAAIREAGRKQDADEGVGGFAFRKFDETFLSDGPTTTLRYREMMQQRQQLELQAQIARRSREIQKEQEQIQIQRNNADRAGQAQAAAIGAMAEGPAKRRLELENHLAAERRKVVNEEADRMGTLKQAQAQEALNAIAGGATGQELAVMHTRHLAERKNVAADSAGRISETDVEAGQAKRNNERVEQEERISDNNAFQQAINSVNLTGYARQMADLRETNAEKVAEYTRAGRDTTTLVNTNSMKELALVAEHNRTIVEQKASLDDRLNAATLAVPAMQIAWGAMARQLKRDLSLTAAELEAFHQKFIAAAQAEADKPLIAGIKNTNIDLDLALHKITALQAATAHLKLANPEATPALVEQQAKLQEQVRTAQWARQQLEGINNTRGKLMVMEDYAREIRAAVKSGQLKAKDADELFRRKAFETGLTAPMETGKFETNLRSGSSAGGREQLIDFSALNMNIPRSAVQTETKNGQVLETIRDYLGRILQKETLN